MTDASPLAQEEIQYNGSTVKVSVYEEPISDGSGFSGSSVHILVDKGTVKDPSVGDEVTLRGKAYCVLAVGVRSDSLQSHYVLNLVSADALFTDAPIQKLLREKLLEDKFSVVRAFTKSGDVMVHQEVFDYEPVEHQTESQTHTIGVVPIRQQFTIDVEMLLKREDTVDKARSPAVKLLASLGEIVIEGQMALRSLEKRDIENDVSGAYISKFEFTGFWFRDIEGK